MQKLFRKFPGVIVLIIAVLIRIFFALFNSAFESIYFNGLFRYIRMGQDTLSCYLPLTGYYLIALVLLLWLIWRRPVPISKRRSWIAFLRRFANLFSYTVALFLVLWGYNYVDRGLGDRMNLPPDGDKTQLAEAYIDCMDRALKHRAEIPGIDLFETIEDLKTIPADSTIGNWMKATLKDFGYPVKTHIRVRHMRPDGLLRRLSISGIYNPFTGEANVDNALGPLQKTFTVAHELAHGHGITSEAEANFAAYLACLQSGDPLAGYAAEYVLWRNLASEVNKHYPQEIVTDLASRIPEVLQKDREAIWLNHHRYKGYFPALTYQMNDAYLKIQGIEAGAADYDGFVNLYFDWIAKNQ